ncbi:MAG: hypothetical protein LBC02_12760 [Planctomycetaceae bacterium]|jgi:hypothetical protein|nr:hypothetical protein [Planctomycetaceae bacterium]
MKKFFAILTIAAILAVSIFAVSPSFRTWVFGTYTTVTEWTPEAIQADPEGYAQFVKRQLETDLNVLEPTLRNLLLKKDKLAKLWKEKNTAVEQGQALAEQAADAISNGSYPVVVAGKKYNEEQLKSQLALWLAQIEVKKELVTEITKVQADSEKERTNLIINIEKTKSQLALVDTRIEIWRSKAITAQGLAMIAEVNAVLEGNQIVIQNDPVRGIDEALADLDRNVSPTAVGNDKVEAYLANYIAKKSNKPAVSENVVVPAQAQTQSQSQTQTQSIPSKGKSLGETKNIPEAPIQ